MNQSDIVRDATELILENMQIHIWVVFKDSQTAYEIENGLLVDRTEHGEQLFEVLPFADKTFCQESLKKLFKGEITNVSTDLSIEDGENKNNAQIYKVDFNSHLDADGEVNYVVIRTQNITQSAAEHRHLLQYQRKTQILNRKYKISLWSVDPDEMILRSDNSLKNKYFRDYAAQEVLIKIPSEYRDLLIEKMKQICNRQFDLQTYVLGWDMPSGERAYLQFVPEKLTDDAGNILRYLFICRDITQERKQEIIQKNYIEHMHIMTQKCGIRFSFYELGTNMLCQEDPLLDQSQQKSDYREYLKRVHPDDRSRVGSYFQSYDSKTAGQFEFTYQYMPEDDDMYHRYRLISLPVYNEMGDLMLYRFTRIDITKESANQEMLRFSQRIGQIGSWTYDLITGVNIWSDEMFDIVGIEHTDGKVRLDDFIALIHPEDHQLYLKTMKESFELGKNYTFNLRIITPQGELKRLENKFVVLKDHTGKPIFVIGTLMDITDRIHLKEENEKAHELLSSILKSIPTMLFIKDIENDFRFVMVNDMFARFLGADTDTVEGKKESEITSEEVEAICRRSDIAALDYTLENPLKQIEAFPDGNGGLRYLQSIKFAHLIKGRRLLMCAATDVTELQKAKSRAEESERLKSAFLANMSHEIRTPLNAIVGFSGLIVDNVSPEENLMFKEVIHTNTEHLLRLINDILDLSKLEANMMQFFYSEFSVNKVLKESARTVENLFKEKGLKLIQQLPDEELMVCQDRVRISEIVNNFLTNACKNTDAGSVTLRFSCDEDYFTIFVDDTGKGIPLEKQKLIFERFEKLDSFGVGTGLGLTICKAISQSLGGSIGVDSTLGKGSSFWVKLPRRKSK